MKCNWLYNFELCNFKSNLLSMTHKALCDLAPADLSTIPAFHLTPFLCCRHSELFSFQNKAWSLTPQSMLFSLPGTLLPGWLNPTHSTGLHFIIPCSVKPFPKAVIRFLVFITLCWIPPCIAGELITSHSSQRIYDCCLCKTLPLSLVHSLIFTPLFFFTVSMHSKATDICTHIHEHMYIALKCIPL